VKIYSHFIFNTELSLEQLRNMTEPLKNVFLSDMLETVTRGKDYSPISDKIMNLPSYEKIVEFCNMLSAVVESII
jgi:hypothetical protein